MQRKGLKKFRIIISITLAFLLLSGYFGYKVNAFTQGSGHYREIVVQKGDTLWSIAMKNTTGKRDMRAVIYQIRKQNKLDDAVLQPGQHLLIPHNDD